MKYLIAGFAMVFHSVTAQSSQDDDRFHDNKMKVYRTSENTFSQAQVDSIRYKANDFVAVTKTRETSDSIHYTLVHFEKSLVPERYQVDGTYCGNQRRIGLAAIRKQFPYNEMSSVKFVSFKQDDPSSQLAIPKTDGKVDFEKMFEVKVVDARLTNNLLDILANYHNRSGQMDIAFCYEPRNAVIFLDKSDRVIGYIEICFACQQFKVEPKTMKIGGFCNEKMDAIQGLFLSAGITYGMNRYDD